MLLIQDELVAQILHLFTCKSAACRSGGRAPASGGCASPGRGGRCWSQAGTQRPSEARSSSGSRGSEKK